MRDVCAAVSQILVFLKIFSLCPWSLFWAARWHFLKHNWFHWAKKYPIFLHLCLPFLPSLNSLNVTSVFASVCSLHLHHLWPPLLNLVSESAYTPLEILLLVREVLRGLSKHNRAVSSRGFPWAPFETSFAVGVNVCRSSGSDCFPKSCVLAGEWHCHLSAFALPCEPWDVSCLAFHFLPW